MNAAGWLRFTTLVVATTLAVDPGIARTDPNMVLVPGASLLLGSTMSEVIAAAATCTSQAEDPTSEACSPERFADEINPGKPKIVRSFLLDKVEVSVAQYDRCVHAGRCTAALDPRRIDRFHKPTFPAVFVRQIDAIEYCRFRDSRLPTEAEFELAMRGPGRRRYPWGGDYHHGVANAGRTGASVTDQRDGYEMLAPTRAFRDGRAPEGTIQLSGNAAEWTSTPYRSHSSDSASADSSSYVVKGGSFMTAPMHLRGAARRSLTAGTRSPDVGFRCARDLIPTSSVKD